MKNLSLITALMLSLGVAACHKKETKQEERARAPAVVQAPVAMPAATPPAAQTSEERERAEKQAKLDYATMEDKYMNDPRAQWASSAKASTTYGERDGKASDSYLPKGATGPIDGERWANDRTDLGFDWLELGFAKAVNATEIRIVFPFNDGVETVSKVELQDTDGNWHTVWSGINDDKDGDSVRRAWFVKAFEKTAYRAKAMKVTIANSLKGGYKKIDAVQLVGD